MKKHTKKITDLTPDDLHKMVVQDVSFAEKLESQFKKLFGASGLKCNYISTPMSDDWAKKWFVSLDSTEHPADEFDRMTAAGYKLNLIDGTYYR